jgi:hypothetical protein
MKSSIGGLKNRRIDMDLHFNKGDTFVAGNQNWIIVGIDNEDCEYPYECYPVETVQEAKRIVEEGVVIDDDVFDDYTDVLDYEFVDERMCWSDFDIVESKYEAAQKEIEALKAEIEKLKGEN